jgi:hypothetical protein
MSQRNEGDNMLKSADILNTEITRYLLSKNRRLDEDYISTLEDYKLDILEYMRDIPPYQFASRSDGLTKDEVIFELKKTLKKIELILGDRAEGKIKRRSIKRKGSVKGKRKGSRIVGKRLKKGKRSIKRKV